MKRTVKALQDLYVKLGGQLTDTYAGIADGIKVGLYKRIPDIIEAVKEKASSGGGGAGLPEVTAADNGDVLTVVEGAWAKAQPIMRVNLLYDAETYEYSMDKTYAEIISAFKAGTIVFLVDMSEGQEAQYRLNKLPIENEPIQFIGITEVDELSQAYYAALTSISVNATNEVTYRSYNVALTA